MRKETFFTLGELNKRIAQLAEDLNTRTMRTYGTSRRDLYEKIERAELKPLASVRFVYGDWLKATVSIDYHLSVDHHFYSVPFQLVGKRLDVRLTATTVEIFSRGQRVFSHMRSFQRGFHTTVASHMPKSHQKHLEWTPSRFISWAETIGPETANLVRAIFAERRHPEQGYRSCLGILRLAKRYNPQRLEAAAARAVAVRAHSYRHIDSILKKGLDRLPLSNASEPKRSPVVDHENLRGAQYYR